MTAATATRKVGSKVSVDHPDHPGVFTVKSNGPANAKLEPVGGGRILVAPHYLLTDPVEGVTVTAVPLPEYYNEGEVVQITDGKFVGVWVVIKDGGRDKVNLAKLGGDNGRYLRATKRGLKRVALADLPALLA